MSNLSVPSKNIKVAVGLSGGVDSAVSAYLLKEAGYHVEGVYMQCWEVDEDGCAANPDRSYAVQGASNLGIKIHQLDFIKEYEDSVIEYFYSEYRAGRTPNPDIMCNKEIKFGLFYDWAMREGFDYVATGHYARIQDGKLLKGVDASKDQSYFLYPLKLEQLEKVLFPVGGMLKKDVRTLAGKVGLPNANRPDSTGICFIGEVDIKDFIKQRISPKKGVVKSLDGVVIGDHEGIWYYTIGQRKGFNLNTYSDIPLYILKKDVDSNTLIVGPKEKAFVDTFNVSLLHWLITDIQAAGDMSCDVRIRHLGETIPCVLTLQDVSSGVVKLSKPIFAVAEGQSAVFYDGDVVLSGGVITG